MKSNNFVDSFTDKRQAFLCKYLQKDGYHVIFANEMPKADLSVTDLSLDDNCCILLLPVPCSEILQKRLMQGLSNHYTILGGNLSADFISYCEKEGISYIDYMHLPTVAIENAVATAEGAICQAIQTSVYNLHNNNSLIIGYGKCGEILADKLQGLKSKVTISTRDEKAKSKAKAYGYELLDHNSYSKFQFIFNTAPAKTIQKEIIDQLSNDTVIIDIASFPGGTDFNYCKQKGIIAKHCPGLPGKYSPKTSAQIIYNHIHSILESSHAIPSNT